MVPAQWHLSLSTQRQSSVHPSSQRQSWVSSLHKVCDVLYDGPLSQGLLLGATESHLPHWSGHGIHIGHPCCLILYDAAGTHGCHSGAQTLLLSLRGPGALCEFFLAMGPSSLVKPRGGVTYQVISSSFVGDGGSDLMLCTFDSSGCCHWTILSPELWL